MSFRKIFRFLSCAYAYLHDKNPKTFKFGHDTPFPIGDWNSKATKKMDGLYSYDFV